jgi:DNA processing protein
MKPSVTTDQASLTIITLADERYPERLRTIADPPAVLYCDGVLASEDRYAIAIVGARQATPYGLRITTALARELAASGFTIVSGLARGIDAAAHRAALEAGGRTIAVLGCGLDMDYPPQHAALRKEIAASGAALTEFAPGTLPLAHHFPKRNRIISGLALGVVVVEAAEGSGSLITARLALEQGREVFAVPGPVDAPMSRGPHGLLKQGAKLTETVDDIVEELLPQLGTPLTPTLSLQGRGEKRDGLTKRIPRPRSGGEGEGERDSFEPPNLSPDERIVYALVGGTPVHIDDLAEQSRLAPAIVAGVLLGLELKTAVRRLPGQRYERTR